MSKEHNAGLLYTGKGERCDGLVGSYDRKERTELGKIAIPFAKTLGVLALVSGSPHLTFSNKYMDIGGDWPKKLPEAPAQIAAQARYDKTLKPPRQLANLPCSI